jgi:hypothetical protein
MISIVDIQLNVDSKPQWCSTYPTHRRFCLPLPEVKIQHERHTQKSASHCMVYVTRLSVTGIHTLPAKIFLNSSGGNLTLRKLA